MIAEFALIPEIGTRVEASKSLEIVDEMRLVEIATAYSNVRPLDVPAVSDVVQRLSKAANAAKQFGCQTNFLAEKRDETFGTKAEYVLKMTGIGPPDDFALEILRYAQNDRSRAYHSERSEESLSPFLDNRQIFTS